MSIDLSRLARHDLLVVASDDWTAVAATRTLQPALSIEADALVERWGRNGWPVVVRRRTPGDAADLVPVGLPLPPSAGKARTTLAIPANVGATPVPGLTLAAARGAAPTTWHATIDETLSLAASLDLVPRVFGALLWQFLTGMTYLRPGSDLDLLWPLEDPAAMAPLLDGLHRIDAAAPMRIDGEVLTGRGGVAWRELSVAHRGKVDVVLAKSLKRTGFVSIAHLLTGESASCP